MNSLAKYALSPGRCSIFLFHGVIREQVYKIRNYNKKHLLLARFTEVLNYWKSTGTPLSMDRVIEHCTTSTPFPDNSFAITFDDGFENNLTVAAEVLAHLNLPATFYVTTGFIEHNGISWIDKLEMLFENENSLKFGLPWRTDQVRVESVEEKIACLDEIRRNVKADRRIDPESFVANLVADTGANFEFSATGPLDKKMTWAQVAELASHELFTVGGHTHSHRILAYLSKPDLECEISQSIKLLSEKSGIKTKHYSYPEGFAGSYSKEVIDVLSRNGVQCCPTAIEGDNDHLTSLFELRRRAVT